MIPVISRIKPQTEGGLGGQCFSFGRRSTWSTWVGPHGPLWTFYKGPTTDGPFSLPPTGGERTLDLLSGPTWCFSDRSGIEMVHSGGGGLGLGLPVHRRTPRNVVAHTLAPFNSFVESLARYLSSLNESDVQ